MQQKVKKRHGGGGDKSYCRSGRYETKEVMGRDRPQSGRDARGEKKRDAIDPENQMIQSKMAHMRAKNKGGREVQKARLS